MMVGVRFSLLVALIALWGSSAANFTLCDIDASVCDDCASPCTNCERVTCIYDYVTELDLSDLNITQLPANFSEMFFLTNLNLDKNELRSLGESFGNLKKLVKLYANYNSISTLPESFGGLKSLNILNLYHNNLKSLPKSFGELSSLETLDLSENELGDLTPEFYNLKSLVTLELSKNSISHISDDIKKLDKLTYINLENNKLVSLPESFKELKSLTYLILSGNSLETIPDIFNNLTSLEILDLSSNKLKSIPDSLGYLENLQYLDLSGNSLSSIPSSFSNLSKIQSINLNGNYLDCQELYSLGVVYSRIECSQESQRKGGSSGSSNTGLYIALGVVLFVIIVVVVLIVIIVIYKRSKGDVDDDEQTLVKTPEKVVENGSKSSESGNKKKEKKEKKAKAVKSESNKTYTIPHSELVFGEAIGKGVTSSVYEGTWKNNHLFAMDDMGVADFRKECELLSKLHNEYIVKFFGASTDTSDNCIVLEFLPLGSLDGVIQKHRDEITPEYLKALTVDIAKGMEYLHSNNMVHRDLKPGNVLCASLSPSAPVVCKITDFGSSRVLLQETLGQMTKGLGTPQYMSPEVLEGSKGSFKKPSDVYSYSITIYELWAGKNVHEACKLESFFKYVEFILKNNRPPLNEIEDKCPVEIIRVIVRSWGKEPSRRLSFSDICQRLEPINPPRETN